MKRNDQPTIAYNRHKTGRPTHRSVCDLNKPTRTTCRAVRPNKTGLSPYLQWYTIWTWRFTYRCVCLVFHPAFTHGRPPQCRHAHARPHRPARTYWLVVRHGPRGVLWNVRSGITGNCMSYSRLHRLISRNCLGLLPWIVRSGIKGNWMCHSRPHRPDRPHWLIVRHGPGWVPWIRKFSKLYVLCPMLLVSTCLIVRFIIVTRDLFGKFPFFNVF